MELPVSFIFESCFFLVKNLTLIKVILDLLEWMHSFTHTLEVAIETWHLRLKPIFVDSIIVLTYLRILLSLSAHHFLVMLIYVFFVPP